MVDDYDASLIAIAAVVLAGGLTTLHPDVAVSKGVGADSLLPTFFLATSSSATRPRSRRELRPLAASAIVSVGHLVTVHPAL